MVASDVHPLNQAALGKSTHVVSGALHSHAGWPMVMIDTDAGLVEKRYYNWVSSEEGCSDGEMVSWY